MTLDAKVKLLELIVRDLVDYIETQGLPDGVRRALPVSDHAIKELDAYNGET